VIVTFGRQQYRVREPCSTTPRLRLSHRASQRYVTAHGLSMDNTYPTVPGRGLTTPPATELRLGYLRENDLALDEIARTQLSHEGIRNNVESFVGSVEIPLGLVGPLRFRRGDESELVHAVAGTLEGALVASMNRGARAISLGGGFSAHVLHQKMIRTPMFIFASLSESVLFSGWIERNVAAIRAVAEQHSNHARLIAIHSVVVGKSVHVKFVYTTGDATGQNMTTSCTWHATLWIQKGFEAETGVLIARCVVEGNGASDKKVSGFSMSHGRGVHVVAECHLPDRVLADVLRTDADAIVQCFNQSVAMSRLDGMIGYNINVANAIAALFVATGQDLGSLHESSCGVLNVERTTDGLYLSLNLPTLVIGTVGGGTHLPRQREALELMGCYGTGKLPRFASLIAGFALGLEISTYAAIVSGHFAKAHEKLGRNKPVRWLLKSEIDRPFVEHTLNGSYVERTIDSVSLLGADLLDNGILMNLTSRVSRRLCGFVPIAVTSRPTSDLSRAPQTEHLLLKIKPLDREVVEGLHFMATAVNADLADLIYQSRDALEYKDCHTKEIAIYEILHEHGIVYTPYFHGKRIEEGREIYLFIQELLDRDTLTHFNAENHPTLWDRASIEKVIGAIAEIHQVLAPLALDATTHAFVPFEPWRAAPLYAKLIGLAAEYHHELMSPQQVAALHRMLERMESAHARLRLPRTIIHNDFNPRNLALRSNGLPCVYDWELSVVNIPHRDVVEFLCFAFSEGFDADELEHALRFHYACDGAGVDEDRWRDGYRYAIEEFLVTRVSFYLVGDIVTRYEFAGRIYANAFRMLELLED
jgi:hydroxymethylglutaryl-CoA reductase (NADPH)